MNYAATQGFFFLVILLWILALGALSAASLGALGVSPADTDPRLPILGHSKAGGGSGRSAPLLAQAEVGVRFPLAGTVTVGIVRAV